MLNVTKMETSSSSTVEHQQPGMVAQVKNEADDSSSPSFNSVEHRQVPSNTPPHNQSEEQTVMIDNTDGAFFSVDALQYNVANEESGQDLSGVFSYDEVYAMIDASNSPTADRNVGDTSNCQDFIPVGTSDMRQLLSSMDSSDGADSSASADLELGPTYHSSDPFYRNISLTNDGKLSMAYNTPLDRSSSSTTNSSSSCLASESPITVSNSSSNSQQSFERITTNNDGDGCSSGVLASPAAGVTVPLDSGTGQQMKVRKPRGRKPKHVKEAEAAAAAALAAANGLSSAGNSEVAKQNSSPSRQSGILCSGRDPKRAILRESRDDNFPNDTVNHQREAVDQKQPVASTVATTASSLLNNGQQLQKSTDYNGSGQREQQSDYGQSSSSAQMMSLELPAAHHDRRVFLTRRHNNTPYMRDSIANSDYSLRDRLQYNKTCQPHDARSSLCNLPSNDLSATASSYASAGLTSTDGKLEQFFSKRIAAPSNRTIAKPRIIQENKSIYKLLTAPSTPRSGSSLTFLDYSKLSQERWMQTPNPSADGNNSGGSSSPCAAMHLSLEPRTEPDKQSCYQQQQHTASSNAPTQRYIIGPNYQGRVSIRRDGGSCQGESSAAASAGGSAAYGMDSSRQGYNLSPSSASHLIHVDPGSNARYNHLSANQIHEMQLRLDSFAQDNFELRCRVNYLNNVKKQLMLRLREAYERNEDLKMYLLQNSQFSPKDTEAGGFFHDKKIN